MKKIPLLMASMVLTASMLAPASSASLAGSSVSVKSRQTIDGACMAAAVSKRDTAISTALQTVVTALNARGLALSSAWTNNDKDAVKAAWDAFRGTWKTFHRARKAAWVTFKTNAKACRGSSAAVNEQVQGNTSL